MATTLPLPDARHSSTEDVEIAMNDEKHNAMHMEKVESGRNPQVVYGIDEVHQKKVMYGSPLRPLLLALLLLHNHNLEYGKTGC